VIIIKKFLLIVVLIAIISSFIGCQSQQDKNKNLIDKYIKFYNIELKKTSQNDDTITTMRYIVTMQLKDPSYADKINILIKLSGESKKIAGMDKLDPNRIIKNGDKYETFGEFGRNIISDSDIDMLQKNLVKEVELEIIENK
jgi:hypothetical protein